MELMNASSTSNRPQNIQEDYVYDICGEDGRIIDSDYVCLETAIEYAAENEGHSINRLLYPLNEDEEIDYSGELIASEVAWERDAQVR